MRSRCSVTILALLVMGMCGRELAHSAEQSPQAGIGVALKIEDGKVFVGAILPNTSAAESNAIKPDDQILAIAEGNKEPVEVAGMNMAEVVGLLRGPKGTVVRLTIIPAGKGEMDARVVSITRGDVKQLNVFGDGKLLSPGVKAPSIEFTRLPDGKKGELAQYLGKIVVLDVWASWCKPCVQNTERLETLKTEHPEWNGRVEFLAVSADDDRDAAAKLWQAHQWTKITCVWTGPTVLKACHLSGLPGALIIDKKGVIVTNDLSDIQIVLRRLLSGDSAAASSKTATSPVSGTSLSLGSLSGTIVDPDGKPVSGARVWVDTWGDKRLAEARSDANGHFCLGPVEPVYRHPWPIVIEAAGFAPQCVWGQSYSIFPGVDCSLGEIRFDKGRIFTGKVLDVDGTPCHNAKVSYSVTGRRNDHIGPEQHLTTDSEGRFRTFPLPVGELYLWVTAPERRLAWVARAVQPGGEEALEPFHLERDVPIQGIVKDEHGKPVVGATVRANYEYSTTTDSEGRFTIHGFGPNPHFQLQLRRDGYVFINWGVKVGDDGIHWHVVGDETAKDHGPFQQLSVTLTPEAWIEGRAIDAETGKPVRLKRVVICSFERKANGEVVLSGCRSPRFEQPEGGQFRIPYGDPDEYHLNLSADGYHDAEAFTPKVTELRPIEGIVVKLKKKTEDTAAEVPKQNISGTVTRNGKPVSTGWVSLWKLREQCKVGFGWRMRGRTAVAAPSFIQSTPVRDRAYSLNVPYQLDNWYVVVEEPNQSLTQVGPIKIAVNEKRLINIVCTEGGSIRGRVKHVPPEWKGYLWVVAFTKTGIQMEARVSPDGEFSFPQLPPGKYGLKVGHDAYHDSELPSEGKQLSKEEWNREIDPWQRAKAVTVEASHETSGVELELPP